MERMKYKEIRNFKNTMLQCPMLWGNSRLNSKKSRNVMNKVLSFWPPSSSEETARHLHHDMSALYCDSILLHPSFVSHVQNGRAT